MQQLWNDGTIPLAIQRMLAHFRKWRESEEFRKEGKHKVTLWWPSAPEPPKTKKVQIPPTLEIFKVKLEQWEGGKAGRVLELRYAIGGSAKTGAGLFRFGIHYLDHRELNSLGKPRFFLHCHLIYGRKPNLNIDIHYDHCVLPSPQ